MMKRVIEVVLMALSAIAMCIAYVRMDAGEFAGSILCYMLAAGLFLLFAIVKRSNDDAAKAEETAATRRNWPWS